MKITKYRIIGLIFVVLIPVHLVFNFDEDLNGPDIMSFGLIFVLFFTSLYSLILDHLPIELTDEEKQKAINQKVNSPVLLTAKFILNLMIIVGLLIMMLGLVQKVLV
ncbi:hypothetical protein [Marinicella litoralis]|uniref:Uncharacterized protein n=1 Tax=Marinicella litoralis TaxID=644220 RepID=A0A4R6XJL5_9GAMM|nr:hypothetical protein [Marinicella litoralis]TDR17403.1 hypothetical protein C8D91_2461 [Marinicella litoralis]